MLACASTSISSMWMCIVATGLQEKVLTGCDGCSTILGPVSRVSDRGRQAEARSLVRRFLFSVVKWDRSRGGVFCPEQLY